MTVVWVLLGLVVTVGVLILAFWLSGPRFYTPRIGVRGREMGHTEQEALARRGTSGLGQPGGAIGRRRD